MSLVTLENVAQKPGWMVTQDTPASKDEASKTITTCD
jgi:hypothetical protein